MVSGDKGEVESTLLCWCSRSKASPGSSPNSHLVGVAVAATVPMAVTQIVLAWISLAFEVPLSCC